MAGDEQESEPRGTPDGAGDTTTPEDTSVDDLLDAVTTSEDSGDETAPGNETDPDVGEEEDDPPADTDETDSEEPPPEAPPEQEPEEIEQSSSWIEVMEPEEGASDTETAIVCWGRFWGEIEDLAAAFYLVLNPISNSIETLRLAVYGNPTQLEDFHPRMEAEQFEHRMLEYNVQGQAIPKVIYDEVEEQFHDYFDEVDVDTLLDVIQESDHEAHREWAEEFFFEFTQEGGVQFQTRVRECLPETLGIEDATDGLDRTTGSDSSSAGDEEEESDEGDESDQFEVSVLNNPTSGRPADEIAAGDQVFVRIVDDRVQHLPDSLIDHEHSSNVSIPLPATVQSIETVIELPERIADGDPENYRELVVELDEGIEGVGLVYLEDRLKVEGDDDQQEPELDEDFVKLLIMFAVLVVVIMGIVLW